MEGEGVTADVVAEVSGHAGLLTLNRPRALNALSLDMVRALSEALLRWRDDAAIELVAIRGTGREGPFGAFCAGGDIRFFHQAVLAGDPALEDFFTEEYRLDHLVHRYPKPVVALLDGIVMGGGMGLSQGAAMRIVTERTKMAMPETTIGLFPDVGGGWFLGRCPGRIGDYLALTGDAIGGDAAIAAGLADALVPCAGLPALWEDLAAHGAQALSAVPKPAPGAFAQRADIDRLFALPSVLRIVQALEAEGTPWAEATAATLRKRSPLMLGVTFEQLARARSMDLADDLRMERGLMHRCFHLRPGPASETMEGIRALAIDKDMSPQWSPSRLEDVTGQMVARYFDSPWPPAAHPLRDLG